jgi:hypothetical protein
MFVLFNGGVLGDLRPLPDSQLAVRPGTTHVTLLERVSWMTSLILTFLGAN